MPDRVAELRGLVDQIRAYESVDDAWVAKSFTDQLLVVDVEADEQLPAGIKTLLSGHGLIGVNEVYGTDGPETSFMRDVGEANRHQFVDVETRGDHQSYVVD